MQNPARHPGAAPRWAREDGYTIVEIMVAVVILLIGVLGTLVMLVGGIASTGRTSARDQGTNLARDLVERTREVSYSQMSKSTAGATLAGRLSDSSLLSGSTFHVSRRNVDYKVTVTACSIDDPTDGAGKGDATFCAAGNGAPGPGPPPPTVPQSAINVLGIDVTGVLGVTAGGSALDTVCKALGLPGLTSQLSGLSSLVGSAAPISVCATDPSNTTSVAIDELPDDLRRVRVDVEWQKSGTEGAVSQTTLLTNPCQTQVKASKCVS